MHDPILEHVKAISAEMGRAKLREEFKTIDRRLLSKMSDNELAIWQSQYPSDSPHFLLSEHEWQRRLNYRTSQGFSFCRANWVAWYGSWYGSGLFHYLASFKITRQPA